MIPAQTVLATAALDRDSSLLDLVDHLTAEQCCEVAEMLRPQDPQAAELIQARVVAGMIAQMVPEEPTLDEPERDEPEREELDLEEPGLDW